MPRYTDLNAILGDLHERLDFLLSEYGEFDAYYCGFEEAVERIEDVSTVDAVEVVRCKDCVSNGERKDDEQNPELQKGTSNFLEKRFNTVV